jgi:hypothetical protein
MESIASQFEMPNTSSHRVGCKGGVVETSPGYVCDSWSMVWIWAWGAVGQQDQKLGRVARRGAEGSKLEYTGTSGHTAFREGGCCLILPSKPCSKFSLPTSYLEPLKDE